VSWAFTLQEPNNTFAMVEDKQGFHE